MDVLLDQQDRAALALELGDGLEDPLDHEWRQPEGRLIEQEQARPAHEGPPDRQHLLLAARQRPAGLLQPLLEQREESEHHVQVGRDRLGVSLRDGSQTEVVADRQATEDPASLRAVRDAEGHDPVGRCVRDIGPFERNGPVRWPEQPRDRAQDGRLARPIRADQRDELAGRDRQRDTLQGPDVAVPDVEVGELKHVVPARGTRR